MFEGARGVMNPVGTDWSYGTSATSSAAWPENLDPSRNIGMVGDTPGPLALF